MLISVFGFESLYTNKPEDLLMVFLFDSSPLNYIISVIK